METIMKFEDHRLVTAKIFYRVPGNPELIDTFMWEQLDRVPDFPKLNDFLNYWRKEIKYELHCIETSYVSGAELDEWSPFIVTMH